MKVTKQELISLIQEELDALLGEVEKYEGPLDWNLEKPAPSKGGDRKLYRGSPALQFKDIAKVAGPDKISKPHFGESLLEDETLLQELEALLNKGK